MREQRGCHYKWASNTPQRGLLLHETDTITPRRNVNGGKRHTVYEDSTRLQKRQELREKSEITTAVCICDPATHIWLVEALEKCNHGALSASTLSNKGDCSSAGDAQ